MSTAAKINDPTIEDARQWLRTERYVSDRTLETLVAYPIDHVNPHVGFEYRDTFGCPITVFWDRRTRVWGACRVP